MNGIPASTLTGLIFQPWPIRSPPFGPESFRNPLKALCGGGVRTRDTRRGMVLPQVLFLI
jgi:hypothetical protein